MWGISAGALFAGVMVVLLAVQDDRDLNTRLELTATPAQVWGVLNDFPAYPEWNPHLRALDGQPQPHSKTRFTEIFVDNTEAVRIIHMKSMAKDYEFIWEAEIAPFPRLLTQKRKLIMTPSPEGGTSLRHEIEFRGLLSGPLTQGIFDRYTEALEAMNTALRTRLAR